MRKTFVRDFSWNIPSCQVMSFVSRSEPRRQISADVDHRLDMLVESIAACLRCGK
jgi:hypothetical protein